MGWRSVAVVVIGPAVVVAMCLAGCTERAASTPAGWRRVDADGRFSFAIPQDMERKDVQGIDSYVGMYLSDHCRLSFDYGFYTSNPPREGVPGLQYEETRIDGKDAIIVSYPNPQASDGLVHVSQVYFARLRDPRIEGKVDLAMFMQCVNDEEVPTAERIFRSIRFP